MIHNGQWVLMGISTGMEPPKVGIEWGEKAEHAT